MFHSSTSQTQPPGAYLLWQEMLFVWDFLSSIVDNVRITNASLIPGRSKPNICAECSVAITVTSVLKAQDRIPKGKRDVRS